MAEATTDADTSDTGNKSDPVVPLHDRPEFVAWLTASCERNKVPVIVADPAVIARIATLLGAGHQARSAPQTRHSGRTRSMATPKTPRVPEAVTA